MCAQVIDDFLDSSDMLGSADLKFEEHKQKQRDDRAAQAASKRAEEEKTKTERKRAAELGIVEDKTDATAKAKADREAREAEWQKSGLVKDERSEATKKAEAAKKADEEKRKKEEEERNAKLAAAAAAPGAVRARLARRQRTDRSAATRTR